MYPYGLIGNCQASALVHSSGSIDWFCAPRPDSPPVFGKLLDPEGGEFSISPEKVVRSEQYYLPNTNILATEITGEDGAFKITDFCPRFKQHGRMYRPTAIFRIVEPLTGNPTIRVKCRPVSGWDKVLVKPTSGNSHLRFEMRDDFFRVVTSMSLTHFSEETPLSLSEPIYFALTWSAGLEEELRGVTKDFLSRTIQYWHTWVKHCSIPSEFQKETIRSALALKLHCYEDTGAILAAMTTSLPEEIGKPRNWDYRLCWLRDSYFTLTAFHNLGHFEEMEGFLKFLLGLTRTAETLKPVYRIDGSIPIPETEHENWAGFLNSRPVRSNNQAAIHVQNDVFGEMILALAPIYFDERFHHLRTLEHEKLLELLALQCAENISKPDAGLWEMRNGWQEHSFTNLMCWAGLDRVSVLRRKGYLKGLTFDVDGAKEKTVQAIQKAIRDGSVRNGPEDASFNAGLLQMPILRFPDQNLARQTMTAIADELRFDSKVDRKYFLYRYKREDDFGVPQASFLFCSFWLVQSLARYGLLSEGRSELERIVTQAANPLGLFSEHFIPESRMQLGNFPQGYSHVGQINAAFAVSPPWSEVL